MADAAEAIAVEGGTEYYIYHGREGEEIPVVTRVKDPFVRQGD